MTASDVAILRELPDVGGQIGFKGLLCLGLSGVDLDRLAAFWVVGVGESVLLVLRGLPRHFQPSISFPKVGLHLLSRLEVSVAHDEVQASPRGIFWPLFVLDPANRNVCGVNARTKHFPGEAVAKFPLQLVVLDVLGKTEHSAGARVFGSARVDQILSHRGIA